MKTRFPGGGRDSNGKISKTHFWSVGCAVKVWGGMTGVVVSHNDVRFDGCPLYRIRLDDISGTEETYTEDWIYSVR